MSAPYDAIPTDEELFPADPRPVEPAVPVVYDTVRLSDYSDPPPTEPAYDPVEALLWWGVVALGTLCLLGALVMFTLTAFL